MLTRTPAGLNSAAQERVIDASAPLVAPYAAPPGMPIWPAWLPMLMMLPLPQVAIPGASAATRKKGTLTLAANSRSKVATSRSPVGPNQEIPALLTNTSTPLACPARSSSWAGSLRSAATNRALPPSAVMWPTTANPRPASRPCTMTSAPCRASSSAAALPMPEVAPVTRALMPSRSRCSSISCPSRLTEETDASLGRILRPSCGPGPRPGYPKHDCTSRMSVSGQRGGTASRLPGKTGQPQHGRSAVTMRIPSCGLTRRRWRHDPLHARRSPDPARRRRRRNTVG